MKFECKQCGKCCSIIKNSEKSIGGLPLFEWEKEELERLASEKGIKLEIGPTDLVFDKKSNSYICINFSLKQEPCPFLKDNKCSIYEKRPLICRYFPLAESPLSLKEGKGIDVTSFLHCHNFDANKFLIENLKAGEEKSLQLTKNKIAKEYSNTFGKEMLVYATMKDSIKAFCEKILKQLIETKKVKLRPVSKLDYAKYKVTPFFEFLVKIAVVNEQGKNEILNDLKDYDSMKSVIDGLENN